MKEKTNKPRPAFLTLEQVKPSKRDKGTWVVAIAGGNGEPICRTERYKNKGDAIAAVFNIYEASRAFLMEDGPQRLSDCRNNQNTK